MSLRVREMSVSGNNSKSTGDILGRLVHSSSRLEGMKDSLRLTLRPEGSKLN